MFSIFGELLIALGPLFVIYARKGFSMVNVKLPFGQVNKYGAQFIASLLKGFQKNVEVYTFIIRKRNVG